MYEEIMQISRESVMYVSMACMQLRVPSFVRDAKANGAAW